MISGDYNARPESGNNKMQRLFAILLAAALVLFLPILPSGVSAGQQDSSKVSLQAETTGPGSEDMDHQIKILVAGAAFILTRLVTWLFIGGNRRDKDIVNLERPAPEKPELFLGRRDFGTSRDFPRDSKEPPPEKQEKGRDSLEREMENQRAEVARLPLRRQFHEVLYGEHQCFNAEYFMIQDFLSRAYTLDQIIGVLEEYGTNLVTPHPESVRKLVRSELWRKRKQEKARKKQREQEKARISRNKQQLRQVFRDQMLEVLEEEEEFPIHKLFMEIALGKYGLPLTHIADWAASEVGTSFKEADSGQLYRILESMRYELYSLWMLGKKDEDDYNIFEQVLDYNPASMVSSDMRLFTASNMRHPLRELAGFACPKCGHKLGYCVAAGRGPVSFAAGCPECGALISCLDPGTG